MVLSCVYPSEKNNSSSLNPMNGVVLPGNSPRYTDGSNISAPGTLKPLNPLETFLGPLDNKRFA